MNPRLPPFLFLAFLFTRSLSHQPHPKPISNITVIGAVFCDACSSNIFSNHSYFLQGARVLVQCKFRPNSTSMEDILITADRTTDRFGIYTLDIPPVDGFECREGREIESFCRASLIDSSSSLCSVPGLRSSTEHVAIKCREGSVCVFNLNALNYRPSKKDAALCGTNIDQPSSSVNTSLFFWPPFWFPWPQWPPLPFPFPSPPSLPFPFPPLPFFTPPPSLPFPFPPLPFFTPPPAFPFPFPPLPPLPPIPSLFPPPSPPPPSFPFPLPPFPPLLPFPPLFAPPPSPPPPPPTPSLPFPFPPFPPLTPAPGTPSPPPH